MDFNTIEEEKQVNISIAVYRDVVVDFLVPFHRSFYVEINRSSIKSENELGRLRESFYLCRLESQKAKFE